MVLGLFEDVVAADVMQLDLLVHHRLYLVSDDSFFTSLQLFNLVLQVIDHLLVSLLDIV